MSILINRKIEIVSSIATYSETTIVTISPKYAFETFAFYLDRDTETGTIDAMGIYHHANQTISGSSEASLLYDFDGNPEGWLFPTTSQMQYDGALLPYISLIVEISTSGSLTVNKLHFYHS